jgi:benzoyl-CoA-dihydrodiol lyase
MGPEAAPPATLDEARDASYWPLRLARELDDAILHLRTNEAELGLVVFRTEGDALHVLAHDAFLEGHGTTGSSARCGTISSACSSAWI